MMKNVILSVCLLLFSTVVLLAQTNPQDRTGQLRRGNRAPGAAMGMIKYDIEEVAEKLNMSNGSQEAEVMALMMEYNVRMDSLAEANTPLFEEIRSQMRSAMQARDFEKLQSMRTENREKLAPIRATAEQIQADLDTALEPILNKKQLKSWEKYKKEKKDAATPRRRGPGND